MGCIIPSDIFHMLVGDNGFHGSFDNGKDNKVRTNIGSLNASLIQVGDKFKILFYKYENAVNYNGEYYGRFKYYSETEFFTDFCSLPCGGNWYTAENHQAYKGIEYLLYTGAIKPVPVAHERYDEFKREEKKSGELVSPKLPSLILPNPPKQP